MSEDTADARSYLDVNRANWDARAEVHMGPDGYSLERIADPTWISSIVRFDQPRLGDVNGLDGVHLQCHLGTDTIGLARLGARMTGVDLSPESLRHARELATVAGVDIDYVEADVYSAPAALGGHTFDLVYTGIGALCWLPDIARWGQVVADLLRPGGRVFVRDSHPVLASTVAVEVAADPDERGEQPGIVGAGGHTVALEFPYWTQDQHLAWISEASYTGSGKVASPEAWEWNHSLSEIVMAVLDAGLRLELLAEHPSLPWVPFPSMMEPAIVDGERSDSEWWLADRPERLPASFTMVARKPNAQ